MPSQTPTSYTEANALVDSYIFDNSTNAIKPYALRGLFLTILNYIATVAPPTDHHTYTPTTLTQVRRAINNNIVINQDNGITPAVLNLVFKSVINYFATQNDDLTGFVHTEYNEIASIINSYMDDSNKTSGKIRAIFHRLVDFIATMYYAPPPPPRRLINCSGDISIVSATLSDFTAVVHISDTTLANISSGGKVINPNGYDINFFADEACTTLLNWSIDTYDAATGELWAFVMLPYLQAGSETDFYIRYGDASITTFQGGAPVDTFGPTAKMILPLGNNTDDTLGDMTSNGNDAINFSSAIVKGKVSKAAHIGLEGYFISPSNYEIVSASLNWSLSFWVNIDELTLNSTTSVFVCDPVFQGCLFFYSLSAELSIFWFGGGSAIGEMQYVVPFDTGTWHNIVLNKTGDLSGDIYVDGVLAISAPGTAFNDISASQNQWGRDGSSSIFKALMDQVEVHSETKSADFIFARYNNQNNPGDVGAPGFFTIGNEF